MGRDDGAADHRDGHRRTRRARAGSAEAAGARMEGFPQQSEGAPGNLESITGSNMAPFLTKLFQIVSASSTVSSIDRRSW